MILEVGPQKVKMGCFRSPTSHGWRIRCPNSRVTLGPDGRAPHAAEEAGLPDVSELEWQAGDATYHHD
jgi:hypothetical protein